MSDVFSHFTTMLRDIIGVEKRISLTCKNFPLDTSFFNNCDTFLSHFKKNDLSL